MSASHDIAALRRVRGPASATVHRRERNADMKEIVDHVWHQKEGARIDGQVSISAPLRQSDARVRRWICLVCSHRQIAQRLAIAQGGFEPRRRTRIEQLVDLNGIVGDMHADQIGGFCHRYIGNTGEECPDVAGEVDRCEVICVIAIVVVPAKRIVWIGRSMNGFPIRSVQQGVAFESADASTPPS